MCDKKRSNKVFNSLCLFIVAISLTACSTTPEHKGPAFDLTKVNKMAFKFENSSPFFKGSLPEVEIGKKVTSNLSEWGYQFRDTSSNEYTHDLSIHVGSVRRGSTPSGFSFSSGNSDPRSLEFQKATIIPLTCSLMPKGQQIQRADLIMEVMADEYKGTTIVDVPEAKMINRLTNDISTTCFNLLSSLNIKTQPTESSGNIGKPGWIPEIRIEIVNDTVTDPLNIEATTSDENSTYQEKDDRKKESKLKIIKDAPRKRIIIHNQGSPVIFQFGHERK